MSARALQIELSVPLLGLAFLLLVAVLASPLLLTALPVVWFLPAALRALGWAGELDERESASGRAAREIALSTLLVLVCALPLLLVAAGDDVLGTLRAEWLDVGFVALLAFLVRALVLGHQALARYRAAHAAGAFAVLMALVLTVGNSVARAGALPAWVALLPLAALLPHALLAAGAGRTAALAWAGGALVTIAYVLAAGFPALEAVLLIGLLALPWAAAAGWAWGPGSDRQPASAREPSAA